MANKPKRIEHWNMKMQSITHPSEKLVPDIGRSQSKDDIYGRFFNFFGLRENPFNVNPDPRYLFLTRPIQEALEALTYGVQTRKGFIVLTGEVGTGKTTLINCLLNGLRQQQTPTAFIFNSHLDSSDLLDFILADFGITRDSKLKGSMLMSLNQWLRTHQRTGATPVLIVDEAQGLPFHVLEEIRLLLNLETSREKLLQIVLVGQPELEEKLSRPDLRQLRERIALRSKIAPLTLEETYGYIQHRLRVAGTKSELVFASGAVNAVHSCSHGIPRVINLLCEHALISAYVDGIQPVPFQIIEEVAREFQLDDVVKTLAAPSHFDDATSTTLTIAIQAFPAKVPTIPPAEAESMEQPDASIHDASALVCNGNPLFCPNREAATPVTTQEEIATIGSTERVGSSPCWIPILFFRQWLYWWSRGQEGCRFMLSFHFWHRVTSSLLRWLQQPLRPVPARRRLTHSRAVVRLGRIRRWLGIKPFGRAWHHR
ncbi:MAG: AAA family ATPase [Candidatus Acidiferrales bacterium]